MPPPAAHHSRLSVVISCYHSRQGRRGRTVRALAYYPALPAMPWHDPLSFEWLKRLQANRGIILEELEATLSMLGEAKSDDDERRNPWVRIGLCEYVNVLNKILHK